MKRYTDKLIILMTVLIAVFNVSSATAYGTYTGNVLLASQVEVDAFVWSEITGSLTISGNDITSLGPISSLTTLGGSLVMGTNPALTDVVDAFPSLTRVGGGIYFYYTDLVTFSGFDALLGTGDNIDFWNNDSLVTLSGFSALHTVGWSLEIGGNPVLTHIPDFTSLETVSSSLFVMDNESLIGVEGLDNLDYVGWSLQVLGHATLESVGGFYSYCEKYPVYTGNGVIGITENSNALPSPTTVPDVMAAGPCAPPLQQDVKQIMSDVYEMELSNGIENKLINSLEHTLDILEKKGLGS